MIFDIYQHLRYQALRLTYKSIYASVVELVDAMDSKSISLCESESSSLSGGTNCILHEECRAAQVV